VFRASPSLRDSLPVSHPSWAGSWSTAIFPFSNLINSFLSSVLATPGQSICRTFVRGLRYLSLVPLQVLPSSWKSRSGSFLNKGQIPKSPGASSCRRLIQVAHSLIFFPPFPHFTYSMEASTLTISPPFVSFHLFFSFFWRLLFTARSTYSNSYGQLVFRNFRTILLGSTFFLLPYVYSWPRVHLIVLAMCPCSISSCSFLLTRTHHARRREMRSTVSVSVSCVFMELSFNSLP